MHTDAVSTADVVETFRVIGMTCHHCEMAITSQLSQLAGVRRVVVDVAAGTVVTESERPLNRDEVAAAVDEAGYELA
jgi:copper chaperone CopZ